MCEFFEIYCHKLTLFSSSHVTHLISPFYADNGIMHIQIYQWKIKSFKINYIINIRQGQNYNVRIQVYSIILVYLHSREEPEIQKLVRWNSLSFLEVLCFANRWATTESSRPNKARIGGLWVEAIWQLLLAEANKPSGQVSSHRGRTRQMLWAQAIRILPEKRMRAKWQIKTIGQLCQTTTGPLVPSTGALCPLPCLRAGSIDVGEKKQNF